MNWIVDKLKWIGRHKRITLVIVVGIYFFSLFIIHLLYKIPIFSDFFVSKWTAGELLSYTSSFLTAAGTLTLGALALWQNHIINTNEERYKKEREEFEVQRAKPCLFASGYTLRFHEIGSTVFSVKIINASDNYALNMDAYDGKVRTSVSTTRASKIIIEDHTLSKAGETKIIFYADDIKFIDIEAVQFKINYTSSLNAIYNATFRLVMDETGEHFYPPTLISDIQMDSEDQRSLKNIRGKMGPDVDF